MKRINLQDMTLDQLVKRFVDIALAEYDAREREDTARYNRLFDQMTELMAEFLIRPVQQRRALMALYDHPNPQVRYRAAYITQDIAPEAARRACEIISERNEYPQAANARRMITNLDEGPADMSWILERAKRARSEG
jgi:Domain of unknown function (DUF2019)